MTDADLRCFQCRATTSTEILGPVSGDEDPFTVTVHGLPVQVCENGHRQFTHSKAALQRLLCLTEEGDTPLPISVQKGHLLRRAACPDCGARLEKDSHERRTFHVEVQIASAPPFGIDVTMPLYRCRGCGKPQLRSRKEIRSHAPAALVRALGSAGIGQG